MTTIPYMHQILDDSGEVLDEIEVELETSWWLPCHGADPNVEIETVRKPGSKFNWLTARNEDTRRLAIIIANAAEMDEDVRDATLADAGTWQGRGPSERFVPKKAEVA